jgi:hypothetical protein
LYNLYVLRNIADYIYQIKQIKITITGGIVKKKKKDEENEIKNLSHR